MFEVLEFKEGNGGCCEVQSQTGFIGLINEVPHIDTICLSYEDDSCSCWTESTTGVVGTKSVSRPEDWIIKVNGVFPNTEMEIMDCK